MLLGAAPRVGRFSLLNVRRLIFHIWVWISRLTKHHRNY